jgi:menaquinone-dependent protoporphyrinogen IX oxidase
LATEFVFVFLQFVCDFYNLGQLQLFLEFFQPFFDRKMIQLIMWMTKGSTNTDAEIEYTNWEKVNEFGQENIEI